MNKSLKSAAKLHENVPPNWYYVSIKKNLGQRFWHNTRFREVGNMVEPTDGTILDIGCADGMFTKIVLDRSGADKVIGIDVLKKSVDWAKKHWKRNKHLEFRLGNAHKLKFEDNRFEAVFALEVLEHVYNPEDVLKEVKRVLKKGGYAVFLVPTDSRLFNIIWFFWTKMRGKIWDDCHVQSYTDDSLVELSKKVGFEVDTNHKFLLGMLQAVKVRKK